MLQLAKVVNANPKAHTVDIVMLDTADRIANVQVLSRDISTNSGVAGLAIPTPPADTYGVQNTGSRDVFAYVAFAGNIPVVLGFKMPEIGQMTFDEPGLAVDRHQSDVYSTTSDDGSWEKAWPSGLWMGVQTTPGHVDRTGTDFDKLWKIARNTGAAYTITLGLPGGKGTIQIDPEGNLSLTVAGAATLSAETWMFNGPVTFADNVTVDQTLTATTDVVGGGKSLKGHDHTGVQTGSGVSGPPQ